MAATQEDQLMYFLDSNLQDPRIDQNYIAAWADRKYQTNDTFLNWVKTIFKSENFLSFFKYLRYPLPSAKLVKNEIEPQLRRVFGAEDADFKYTVQSVDTSDFLPDLDLKNFNKALFEKMLYKHNSILIADLDPVVPNMPFRQFIDIERVISIIPNEKGIEKLAFKAAIQREGKIIQGSVVVDSFMFQFFDNDFNLVEEHAHDLGHTPAHFIVPGKIKGNPIIRESLYTYIREELEEYVFLKTLQRMTEPNGAIPIVTKVMTEEETSGVNGPDNQPDADQIMGSQQAKVFSQNEGQGTGDLQPGTIHEISPEDIRDTTGSLNMDVVTNWINFHFTPIEPLNYLNDRIKDLERSIKLAIVGDVVESNEESKNRLQIEKSISVLENTLTSFGEGINRIRSLSDTDMLGLKYGLERVQEVFIHMGTDFFLESQSLLYEDLEKAPNTLERKNIIRRINQNRHKNNMDLMSRQMILYDLMPYCSDKDFETARNTNTVTDINLQYQIRFNYWISQFEAQFGDIVTFWKNLEGEQSEKFLQVNNLIIEIINNESIPSENIEG